MAVTYRQPATAVGGSTGVQIPAPFGMQTGDLLLAFMFAVENASNGFVAPSAAWTKWIDIPVQLGSVWMMLSIFSKIASGEPPNWTFSVGATASWGSVVAVFDDGGVPVDVDLVASQATITATTSYTAPQIIPSGTVDPYALVLSVWASGAAISLPTIGESLFGAQASTGRIAGVAYPVQKNTASLPVATGGATAWLAAQVAVKALAASGQRRMLRAVSPKASATIPVPTNLIAGDLMLAFIRSTGGAVSGPVGWATVLLSADQLYAIFSRTSTGFGGGSGTTTYSAAYGDMPLVFTSGGGGEPTSYTFSNGAEGMIAAFFDMDGQSLNVDTAATASTSGNGMLFTTPTVVTNKNNEILLSHFASEGGTLVGPYGVADGGGTHRDYTSQSETNNLLSWTLQGVSGLTAARTAYSGVSASWRAAQLAISGQGIPIAVGPDLFPELPGISWSVIREPEASLTVIQKSQSGKEARWMLRAPGRPIWTITLAYEVLRANRALAAPMTGRYLNIAQVANPASLFNVDTLTENEYAVLVGFFNRQGGAGQAWLFDDFNDDTAGLYEFGRGDGLTTTWSTAFVSAWQAQFPSVPLLFTDQSPYGVRQLNTFSALAGATLGNDGTITISPAPQSGQPLYITAPTASYSGQPLLGEQFATGDGVTTSFQLVRWLGGMRDGIAEPIQNLNGLPAIWVDGLQQTPVVGTTGIVTFASAPARGSVISFAGKFYIRMRFHDDSTSFEEFGYSLYDQQALKCVSVLL